MPARTTSTTAPAVKRFELPALDFKFSSLTDGTDIPPPLPSPVEDKVPTPPMTPTTEEKKQEAVAPAAETNPTQNGKLDTTSPASIATKTTTTGTKRPADDNPASPTLSSRPGSIRRLFSRNLLHNAYANGEEAGSQSPEHGRPESRSNGSFVDSKKSKRSSGWFSRLRSNDSAGTKRASVVGLPRSTTEEKRPMGPPPPMIPELAELKSKIDLADEGSLGSDLFKDIK
ncbi:hypothetical protein GQ53DRAFT_657388 [Thozetella sp. PMI_491]|nr:hypothetical protein GQ53DRAFT_657388 [Thozetella sp. PMI_491]